jgi:hypothetical protein
MEDSKMRMAALILVVGMVVTAVGQQSESIDRGLIGYWKFDEGAGATAADASGKGLTGEIKGAKWTDNAKSGKALDFDGNSVVEVKYNPVMDNMQEGITVCAWVNRRASSSWNMVASREVKETWSEWFGLAVNQNKALFSVDPNGGQYSNVTGRENIPLNRWVHLTGTYDNKACKLYLNGKMVVAGPRDTRFAYDDKNPIILGGNTNTNGKAWIDCFNGCIDEIRIYNRPLTEEEILQVYGG